MLFGDRVTKDDLALAPLSSGEGDERVAAIADAAEGDLLGGLTGLVEIGVDLQPQTVTAPHGAVLISQTCDVVLPSRDTVQVAWCVRLTGAVAQEARDGKRPRYVHLPSLGDEFFADLDMTSTAVKPALVGLERVPGLKTDDDVRRFSRAVARKSGRFPFPDEVTPWLRALEAVVSSRVRRSGSPEGQVLSKVVELRVEAAAGWQVPPYDLTLAVIVEPGTLPTFPGDELPDLPVELSGWLYGSDDAELRRSPPEVAGRLARLGSPVEEYWLWAALGEAWAARCRAREDAAPAVHRAVTTIVGEVIPADEYPLTRLRRSEQLDLDHLSAPTPE